jgi:hypothetical protein
MRLCRGTMNEADILQTAKMMLEQYGTDAEAQAAKRADRALLQGSIEGEQIWQRVVAAILEMRGTDS